MVFLTLLAIGAICLVFKTTRLIGVIGVTVLLLLYPLAFLCFLFIGCIHLFYKYIFTRRKLNVYEQPKLPD
jgi:hypothetical protein